MKKLIILLTVLFIQACQEDQRTRFQEVSPTATVVDVNTFDQPSPDNPPQPDPSETPIDDPLIAVNLEPGFENCNLGYQFFGGANIGSFGICQSEINQNTFRIRLAQTDSTVGTCFIPMHINSDGSSFRLGIAECVHNQEDVIYPMVLTTERAEPINGVMVIKAGSALNGFFNCSNIRDQIISSCQPNVTQQCVDIANREANFLCTAFVNNYSQSYVQVNL